MELSVITTVGNPVDELMGRIALLKVNVFMYLGSKNSQKKEGLMLMGVEMGLQIG